MRTVPWWRTLPALGGMAAMAGVVLFDLALGQLGAGLPDFLRFLGRFHPLVVHLPIGIFLLVAAAEALALSPRLAARVEPAFGLALPALVASALGAFVLGHLLSREGGFPAQALAWHRRLALVAVVGSGACLLAWTHHAAHGSRGGRLVYRALLAASLAVLSLGAHFGGTMTRGDDYLAAFAPGFLKPLLGGKSEAPKPKPASSAAPKPALEPLLFADLVLPLLREHCTECHGAEKVKGGLRLDSLEAIGKGGEGGPALVAGSAQKSELVRRLLLPADDDDRMPPEGKKAPSADAIALLRFWIDRGATNTLRVRDALPPPGARALLEHALNAAPKAVPAAAGAGDPEPSSSAGSTAGEPASDAPALEPAEKGAAESDPGAADASAVASDNDGEGQSEGGGASASAILADKCESCHGSSKRKGGLRVDSLGALLKGGEGGPAIVPGAPEQSEIVRRARLPLGDDDHMPPKKKPQLTAEELRVLEAWIRGLSPRAAMSASSSARAEPAPPADSAPGEEQSAATPEATASSEPPSPAETERATSLPDRVALYRDVVMPLLAERCGGCHSGSQPPGGLSTEPYARLVAGGQSAAGLVPGDPGQSLIVKRMRLPPADDDHMPPEGEPQLAPGELELVALWIERGAGTELEIESRDLSGEMAEAAASRLRPPEAEAAPGPAQPEAKLAVHERPGGCACVLGRQARFPAEALALGAAGLLALGFRRGPWRRRDERRASAFRAASR